MDLSKLSDISSLSAGELFFYGGLALGAFTALLALIFLFFRPKYKPESATYLVNEKIAKKHKKESTSAETVLDDATLVEGGGETMVSTRLDGETQLGETQIEAKQPEGEKEPNAETVLTDSSREIL